MVEWTDAERATINSLWSSIDVGEIGPQALSRLLIVYPWTQRHFAGFGNISTNAAILGNAKVAAYGKTVMGGLERAIKNMDDIKNAYKQLSIMHSEKIHVDPDNFRLLSECFSVCLRAKFGASVFTPAVQETWQKFVAVVIAALGRQYH